MKRKYLALAMALLLLGVITGCTNPANGGAARVLTLTVDTLPYGSQILVNGAAVGADYLERSIGDRVRAAAPGGIVFASPDTGVISPPAHSGSTAPSIPAGTVAILDPATGVVTPVANPPASITVVATDSAGNSGSTSVPLTPVNLVGRTWYSGPATTGPTKDSIGAEAQTLTFTNNSLLNAGDLVNVAYDWIDNHRAEYLSTNYTPPAPTAPDVWDTWPVIHTNPMTWVAVNGTLYATIGGGVVATYSFPSMNTCICSLTAYGDSPFNMTFTRPLSLAIKKTSKDGAEPK